MDRTDLCRMMLHAARSPRPTGVGWPDRCGRPAAVPRPSPPPLPPLAAGGSVRARGEAEVARDRRQGGGGGAERGEAMVAAGGNAMAVSGGLVGDSAEGVADLMVGPVPLEERGSGGGGGGGELERKRGLALAARPPPKRRAVSAKRQFPPGCGRGAALLIVGGGEDGLRVAAAPSHGGFSVLEQAAADGGAPMKDAYRHGPEATVVKSSDGAEDIAGLAVKDIGRAQGSGELGMKKELVPIARSPPKRRMVSARRRFPPGCGRDVVAPFASGGLQLEAPPADGAAGGLGALEEVVATDGGGSVAGRCAMYTVEAASKNSLDGAAEVKELEEGEIPTESDHFFQETQVTLSIIPHESPAGRHECAVPAIVAAEPSMRYLSNDMICGNALQSRGKSAAWPVVEDVKVMNECEGSSHKVAAGPSAEGPPKEHIRDKRVSESCSMKRSSLDVAAGVFRKGIMRRKVKFTARKSIRSPVEATNKSALVTLDRPYSMGKEESVAATRESLCPRKKLKVKGPAQSKHLSVNVASTSALPSKGETKGKIGFPLGR